MFIIYKYGPFFIVMLVKKTKSIPVRRCARTSLRWVNKVSTKLGGHCIMGSLLPSLKQEMAMMSIPCIYICVCVRVLFIIHISHHIHVCWCYLLIYLQALRDKPVESWNYDVESPSHLTPQWPRNNSERWAKMKMWTLMEIRRMAGAMGWCKLKGWDAATMG